MPRGANTSWKDGYTQEARTVSPHMLAKTKKKKEFVMILPARIIIKTNLEAGVCCTV